MTSQFLKLLLLSAAIGVSATHAAKADCESDLLQLEAAYTTPNLSAAAKTALDAAKTVSVAALKKDDDAKCHVAVTDGLTKAGIKSAATPAGAAAALPSAQALGDLSAYKAIAEDTLKIVNSNDLKAARTRIKNLEVAWDNAEADMRPRAEDAWQTYDVAIDEALAALRTPNADKAECAKTLEALIAAFERAAKKS